TLTNLAGMLKINRGDVLQKVEQLLTTVKDQEREIQQLQQKLAHTEVAELLKNVQEVAGVKVLTAQVQAPDIDALRKMTDLLRDKLGSGVIILGAPVEDKVQFVAAVSKELTGKLHAGKLVKEVAKVAGGGGGGRPDMAQAGGRDVAKLGAALQRGLEMVNFSLS
ncbi:MAG TPA: DHHA1 domain-containing protein, partial [Desulfobacteria bacterium]|nr:DHHA1 domain-containing protein [Desulfobacteria bacterium]